MTLDHDAHHSPTTPWQRVSSKWVGLFGLSWLGIWLAQLAPFQLTLPNQINDWLDIGTNVDESNWQRSVLTFGVVSGISAVFALVAFPLTGSLSDRTTSRYGRRRPWIIGGTALFAAGLIGLGFSDNIIAITIGWCAALTGFSAVSAALTALISDQVPVFQRGVVSSWVSAPQAIGVIIGIALVSAFGLGFLPSYALFAVVLIACVAPFVMYLDDPPIPRHDKGRISLRAVVSELWVSPREHPDFGWTLLGRVLVNLGNALGTSLLFFFLKFGIHSTDADNDILLVTAVYMVFVVISALVSGKLSDIVGRRKPFVLAAGVSQGAAAVCIAVVADLPMTMVAAALLGAGFGAFLGVDQALATQVLPDAEHNGQDLGIMNIAMAVPQALGPLVGAAIVEVTGGFSGLFVASAVFGILGGVSVLLVRSVR
ncbi:MULTISPECIES: MFS transporter [Gordonia]|uniref:MFS transporter n=1 Tax=Gordonia TaxID=2053 RepID=UPI0007E936C0|nr:MULTISPECIES: MFS transporter [Gordonia]MCM3894584.1 MFS transporter [Gordonia sputi]OBA40329.1 MFS transporter [Gordonia sp. 852002-51296_SCH5728562-b]OBA72771.1 MFS transporter [Gordonia sp. 852002-10350_SCH5691597]